MKRSLGCLGAVAVLAASGLVCSRVHARESEENLGEPKYRNIAKVIRPADVTDAEFARIKRLSVVMTSRGSPLAQIAEDLLAAKLRDMGYAVTPFAKIEEAAEAELEKQQGETERRQRDSAGTDTRLPSGAKMPSYLKVAKGMNLDGLLVGTLVEGTRQVSFGKDNPPQAISATVVQTLCVQLIDVHAEKVLLLAVLDYDKGGSVVISADVVAAAVKRKGGE